MDAEEMTFWILLGWIVLDAIGLVVLGVWSIFN